METMTIPRYTPRLEAWIFKLSFDHDVANLEETLEVINAATTQVSDTDISSFRTFFNDYCLQVLVYCIFKADLRVRPIVSS
jgi:hypothetical protein